MAVTLTIAGQSFQYPTLADEGWGGAASDWAVAVSTQLLQRTGGVFTLANDVNFGASFGLLSVYFKSRSANIADAGIIRLAHTDAIAWRNLANSGNLLLTIDPATDQLFFNGNPLVTSTAALTASRALVTNASSVISSATTTSTEIGYLSGVTSAIQTQLDAKQTLAAILTAITSLATTGIISRTGSGTVSTRTVTGTSNRITVTNGDGVSGNPTLDIGTDVVTLTGSQVLTNKTLTTPAINGELVGVSSPAYNAAIAIAATETVKRITAVSGAVTATLPVGATGQRITIVKTDSTFNAISINNSSAALQTTLNTQGEAVVLTFDGAAWTIENRYVPAGLNTYSPTITNFGTTSLSNFTWKRSGAYCLIQGNFTCGTSAASVASVTLPSGLAAVSGAPMRATGNTVMGRFINTIATGGASDFKAGTTLCAASGTVINFGFDQTTFASSPLTALNGTTVCNNSNPFDLWANVPIAGWNG